MDFFESILLGYIVFFLGIAVLALLGILGD
jgi:hypothetical protein